MKCTLTVTATTATWRQYAMFCNFKPTSDIQALHQSTGTHVNHSGHTALSNNLNVIYKCSLQNIPEIQGNRHTGHKHTESQSGGQPVLQPKHPDTQCDPTIPCIEVQATSDISSHVILPVKSHPHRVLLECLIPTNVVAEKCKYCHKSL